MAQIGEASDVVSTNPHRGNVRVSNRLVTGDLVPDKALDSPDADILDHASVAEVIAALVCRVDTPANVALFGPWGSGKSSIYWMMKQQIEKADSSVSVAYYDAWKFGGRSLQRNFLSNIADELGIGHEKYLDDLYSTVETTRLRLPRFLWRNAPSICLGLLVALLIAGVWASLSAWASSTTGVNESSFTSALTSSLPNSAVVFAAVAAGLLLSAQSLSSAVEKKSRSAIEDADQFSSAFRGLLGHIRRRPRLLSTRHQVKKLVVFVDELDRCSPHDVVATLTDLKTFLDHRGCVFVVAADREVLETALQQAPQAKPMRSHDPYYSTSGAFLDKIFQHQIALPPIRPEALTKFAMTLADQRGGLWAELRFDRRTYEDVVYSLVPAHVRSPRRVKVLMNNFATNVRVIEGRALAWRTRAVEIAVLTVLQTEFPAVVRDLIHQPRLLHALVAPELEWPASLAMTLSSYSVRLDSAANADLASPAGDLMVSPDERPDVEEASRVLNQQLDAYLSKIHAAGVPFPSLDLIYLQTAGHAEGFSDPSLALALDLASDTSPNVLVGQFASASEADRAAAIRYLARKTDGTFGHQRANLVEAACRIAETIDVGLLRTIAPIVAASILAEVMEGRYRVGAVPGAILIGLLSGNGDRTLKLLGENASADVLARNQHLERVVSALEHLDDASAESVHALLGAAYSDYPDPMHAALSDLPANSASRLWTSQAETITSVVTANSLTIAEAEEVNALPAGSVAALEAATRTRDGSERYRLLLNRVGGRATPADEVGVGVFMIGILETGTPLRAAVDEVSEALLTGLIANTAARNHVAIEAIRTCTVDQIATWRDVLTPDGPADPAATDSCIVWIERLPTLPASHASEVALMAESFQRLFVVSDLPRLVDAIQDALVNIGAGPDGNLHPSRTAAYDALRGLQPSSQPSVSDRIRTQDVRRIIRKVSLDRLTVGELLILIPLLSKRRAAQVDNFIAKQTHEDEVVARLRLRVAARLRADRRPLSAGDLVAAESGADQTRLLLSEWFQSGPALAEVREVVERDDCPSVALAAYALTRSTRDRTRLWIHAVEVGASVPIVRAIGKPGVNGDAIDSIRERMLGADLAQQQRLTYLLTVTDIAGEHSARVAARRLARQMLAHRLVGAGAHAAAIAVATGDGQGEKEVTRDAFDRFTAKHPSTISVANLRRLYSLGLLSRRKRSPIARLLRWG